jgi:hypothetical protein
MENWVERTARTLLNMELCALHLAGKSHAIAEETQAMGWLLHLSQEERRIARILRATTITRHKLYEYLRESLAEISQAKHRHLVPLVVPVPPNLEETLGYSGQDTAPLTDIVRDARFLAFYYTTADKPYWFDGLGGQTDRWDGYLAWINHWIVMAGLGPYRACLGAADSEATHMLVLDRKIRLLYLSVRDDKTVLRLLHDQWPPQAWPRKGPEEAESRLLRHFKARANSLFIPWFGPRREDVACLLQWLEKHWPSGESLSHLYDSFM